MAEAAPIAEPHAPDRPPASPWVALAILTLCFAASFTDRQILNLMVDHIKRDLGVTDRQIGFLLGPAFTATYVTIGLLAGLCADRFGRRNLLIVAGVTWSLATFGAAIAPDYRTMVITRLLVGAAEAFLFPAGMSLVADMFDRRRLPLATTIFLTGPYIGGGLALIVGGVIIGYTEGMAPIVLPFGEVRSWQVAIALVGLMGLLPILSLVFLKEPARGRFASSSADMRTFGFLEGTAYMLKRWRFFVMFFLAVSFNSVLLNTVPAWAPTMFTRDFGLKSETIGVIYGAMVLVLGIVGGLASPALNRVLERRYPDSPMRVALLGPLIPLVAGFMLLMADTYLLCAISIGVITFGYVFPLPMGGVSLQLASPPRLRGLSSAYYFVIVSVIAVGIGPTLVPFIAGTLLHDMQHLRIAIAIVTIGCAIASFGFMGAALGGFQRERAVTADAAASQAGKTPA